MDLESDMLGIVGYTLEEDEYDFEEDELHKILVAFTALFTGGIEKFSAKENLRKILKVSHLYLSFSSNKNHNEIKHSQRGSLDFLDPNLENSNETLCEPEKSNETLLDYLILLWFSLHENSK